jgi:hypothetical protein
VPTDTLPDHRITVEDAHAEWRAELAADRNYLRHRVTHAARLRVCAHQRREANRPQLGTRARARSRRTRTVAAKPSASGDSDPDPDLPGGPEPFFTVMALSGGSAPSALQPKDSHTDTATQPDTAGDVSLTQQLATRLELLLPTVRLAELKKFRSWIARLRVCGTRELKLINGQEVSRRPVTAKRCGLAICPSCQAELAVKQQDRLTPWIRECLAAGIPLALIRLSIAEVDSLAHTIQLFGEAFTLLRRRKLWSDAVVGGAQFVDPAPALDGKRHRWNVHAHLVVELVPGVAFLTSKLAALWTEILAALGATGGVDAKEVHS